MALSLPRVPALDGFVYGKDGSVLQQRIERSLHRNVCHTVHTYEDRWVRVGGYAGRWLVGFNEEVRLGRITCV